MTNIDEMLFIKHIKMLQTSSKETVVHADSFDDFPRYMHTERDIEKEIVKVIDSLDSKPKKQLILLAGSVGDGKSHLLSYLKDSLKEKFKNIFVHNDATESHDPESSSVETLEKILQPFNDGQVAEQHMIIAINLGVLHNFYHKQKEQNKFIELCKFIESIGIFDQVTASIESDHEAFHLFNFASVRVFSLTENGAISPFFEAILQKIVSNDEANPIYTAWKKDMENGFVTMAHLNYQLLQDSQIQKRVLEKLYHIMLLDKLIISTRAFYHFIFTILVPTIQELDDTDTGFSLENTLPFLLYNHPERSYILAHTNKIDPLRLRNRNADEYVTNLHILTDKWSYVSNLLSIDGASSLAIEIYGYLIKERIHNKDLPLLSKFLVRIIDLIKPAENSTYNEFLKYLYHYHKGNPNELKDLFEILRTAFINWKGSPKKHYYYTTNDVARKYRVALPLKLNEAVGEDFGKLNATESISTFENYITIGFEFNKRKEVFELDFHLYELLKKIKDGYRPNASDLNNALQFDDFYKQLMSQSEENSEEILIVRNEDQSQYIVSKPGFSFSGKKYKVESI